MAQNTLLMEKITCECGREFINSQSYCAHCGFCKTHLSDRYDEKKHEDRIGEARSWSKGKNKSDTVYGKSISKVNKNRRHNTEDILSNKIGCPSNRLKYRLLEEGYKEWMCENCRNIEWMGEKIPLELHHKDGVKDNNSLDNIELICPNCHSFTNTYRGKNTTKHKR